MYLFPKSSRRREREAQNARTNRNEIRKALANGEVTKRDLIKWGLFTAGGALVVKNGLSPFARSSFAAEPTGTPRTPLFGAGAFTQPFNRVREVPGHKIQRKQVTSNRNDDLAVFLDADGTPLNQPAAKRLSYHTDFNLRQTELGRNPLLLDQNTTGNQFRNPITERGPMEGRPWGEAFSHQRWDEYFPKVGHLLFLGQCEQPDPVLGHKGTFFHPSMAPQEGNSVWTYGYGPSSSDERCEMPPCLVKLRYGEPTLTRVYNTLPVDRAANNGFGVNQSQLHFHNMHNGAESDGAANVHHFPGTFYDYRWSTTLARRDTINTNATDRRASGPDGNGGLVNVPGDFREIQGSMWAHDHRFFFTAENVYKGNLMMCNMYSGPDRGNETLSDGVNLRLPSGSALDWGNTDFDVNVIFSDGATDLDGQYFFDIFTNEGFLGDMPLVNFAYKPVMKVLPRKYRLRLINCCMSRFIKLALADPKGRKFPVTFIANDGNLVVSPLVLNELDEQGIAERYDIIVDFSSFKRGDKLHLVNLLQQTNPNKPDKVLSISDAINGKSNDPCVGSVLRFEIVAQLESVDAPGVMLNANDPSVVPPNLTEQIPIVSPVRTRHVEFKKGIGNSKDSNGQCTPDCSQVVELFPWMIRVNGETTNSFNANRISLLIPKPGEVEHWTYENGGGGWDHPIHLHFEEGVTMSRSGAGGIPDTEKLVRKDVWRLRPGGSVKFQVQFGEYGGSYVNHCHNTVHEDFAMLLRLQVLGDPSKAKDALDPTKSVIRGEITATPNPTPDGVVYTTPTVLPEGNPTKKRISSNENESSTPPGGALKT